MPQNESLKIKIKVVNGGKDQDDLKQCYFYPSAAPNVYDFYTKDGVFLAGNLSNGCSFSFTLDSLSWRIGNPGDGSQFQISPTSASGTWNNNDLSLTNEESGTFHAQAGGTVDREMTADADEAITPGPAPTASDIVIHKAESHKGGSGGQLLLNCYFVPISGTDEYSFHDSAGQVKDPSVKSKQQFRVHMDGAHWKITADFENIGNPLAAKAKGDWKILGPKEGEDEDSGTFHAQAGGGAGVEEASSATA